MMYHIWFIVKGFLLLREPPPQPGGWRQGVKGHSWHGKPSPGRSSLWLHLALPLRLTQGTIRTESPNWQPWLLFFLRILAEQVSHRQGTWPKGSVRRE
jgi:hypothetical protein